MQPETKAVEALLPLFDNAPDDFRHNGQTLRQRVEGWVGRVVEEVGDEIQTAKEDMEEEAAL